MYSEFLRLQQKNQVKQNSVASDVDKDLVNLIREKLYLPRKNETLSAKGLDLFKREGEVTRLFHINIKDDFCPSKFIKTSASTQKQEEVYFHGRGGRRRYNDKSDGYDADDDMESESDSDTCAETFVDNSNGYDADNEQ